MPLFCLIRHFRFGVGLGWKCVYFRGENFCFIRDLGLASGARCGPRLFFYLKLYWTSTLEELLKCQ